MRQYLELMRHIRDNGVYKADRTGTGTYSVFGHQMRFNLAEGFPLVTTKKCHLKSIIHELLWFLQGDTNIKYLKDNGVSIWDEWVKEETAQWRELSVQERLLSVDQHSSAAAQISDFFDKYEGNPELWAEEYTVKQPAHATAKPFQPKRLLNKDGYDFLPDFLDKLNVKHREPTEGDIGPAYGYQWRSWPNPTIEPIEDQEEKQRYLASGLTYSEWLRSGKAKAYVTNGIIDQIANLVEMIKKNPDSRRLIVTAWNPAQVDDMALPPCHCLFQFYLAPMTAMERWTYAVSQGLLEENRGRALADDELHRFLDSMNLPARKLSCQLYQRKQHCAFVA